jgi:methyl-accepting chemotaxis protein
LTVEGALQLAGKPNHGVTIVLMLVGYLIGGAIALLTVRELLGGMKKIDARLDACAKATSENLLPALQALAAGDLTVELHASTAAVSDFAQDELGQIMRHIEIFRGAVSACYDAYNQTAEKLRELIGSVSATAASVNTSSQEMSSNAEETGRATTEIAQAITDVAQGAERQARMAESAKQSAEEIAHAVAESAENAERTAEVAHEAEEATKNGVDAAEQANQAMQSVRDSSEAVSEAIRELAGKSDQIGTIVQTITGIAEQTNLLAIAVGTTLRRWARVAPRTDPSVRVNALGSSLGS